MKKNEFTNNDNTRMDDSEPLDGYVDGDGEGASEDESEDYFDDRPVRTGAFRLEQYMKAFNIAASGGQAKVLIQSGQVRVNGKVETRRKRQLQTGDKIQFLGETWMVPENV